MTNWKTTTLGILMIVAAVVNAGTQYLTGKTIDFATLSAAVLGGWAAIHAKDATAKPTV